MRSRIGAGIAVLIFLLGMIHGGCAKHIAVAPQAPPPQSLEGHIRTLIEIFGQNSGKNDLALKQLHEQEPELAQLAIEVEKAADLTKMRELADSYLREGAYLSAFELYQELRLKAPEDPGSEIGLARIWDAWGDFDQAKQHADRAVALAPYWVTSLETRGRILLHQKELDAALAAFMAALQVEPENPSVLANTGYVHMLRGEWEKAKPFLARSAEIDASVPEVRNNLGIVFAFTGERDRARKEFMTVNRPAAAFNNVGVALMAQGDWKAAKEEFEQALRLDPTYEKARENLAEAAAHLSVTMVHPVESFSPSSKADVDPNRDMVSPFAEVALEPRSPMTLSAYTWRANALSQEDAATAEAEALPCSSSLRHELKQPAERGSGTTSIRVASLIQADPFQVYKKVHVSIVEGRAYPTPYIPATLLEEHPTF